MTFRSLSLCAALAGATLFAQVASAQMGPVTGVTPTAVPTLSPENGFLLSDGALLHGGLTVEGGYDSNIFYNDKGSETGSPLLRVSPFLDFTNTARTGEVPSGLFFDVRAGLTYREYLSSDPDVTRLRSVSPTVSANVEHNSRGTLAFGFSDTFARLQDAPYLKAERTMIVRDTNTAAAQLRLSPGGGRIQGVIRLTNMIDWFEQDSQLTAANSMTNELMLDASWRWLPKTALYLQVRQGYVLYFDPNAPGSTALVSGGMGKQTSFPLRAVLGVRGLVTEKTSIALALGYQNAFYSGGVNTTSYGFLGSTTAVGELTYLPIFQARFVLGFHHDFQNSVVGNFYYNDGGYVSVSYQSPARVVGQLWGSYDYRRYRGLPDLNGGPGTRNDNFIQAGALLDYHLKSWCFVGISYSLANNQSDAPMVELASGADYTKHQVFARVGVTY